MSEGKFGREINPCVLIAIDGSLSSMNAVNYAVHMTGLIPDLEFDLLAVLPSVPPHLEQTARTDGHMLGRLKKLKRANIEKAELFLAKAKEYLIRHGVTEERIRTKFRPRIGGVAKDILTEAEQGLFDALIVGRRGLSRTQELIMGSVTSQIVQHAVNVPLWLVDGKITDPKILVAVDGSQSSLRAVDHVAFMLGRNPEARVAFLHVTPKFQTYCPIDLSNTETQWAGLAGEIEDLEKEFLHEDEVCIDDFFRQAAQILKQSGFTPDRISFIEKEISMGVARTIINVAREEGFGTIVIGRRGLGSSSFLGGVSDRVIRRVEGLAVWLVN